jgi:hypothetical protein
MSLTSKQKSQLTKMNRAAQNVELGTLIGGMALNAVVTGSAVVVTNSHASASTVIIDTGLTSSIGQIVQVRRSGSNVITPTTLATSGSTFSNIKVTNTGSYLIVSACSTASCVSLAAGDIVSWIAF